MSARSFSVCCLLACLAQIGFASDLKVPQQYPTIQQAIQAAQPGDRVLVSAGVFKGAGNVDLDFHGKGITVQGAGYLSTIIDCEGQARGFIFHSGEASTSIVKSLTIKRAKSDTGGAIAITNSSPAFVRCSIEDCGGNTGGAVYISGGSPGFISTVFKRNHAVLSGGAIYSDNSALNLTGCTFDGNETNGAGGALRADGGALEIEASVFNNNVAEHGGGAISASGSKTSLAEDSFCENSTFENGGAIDLSNGAHASLSSCTIAANLSHRGSGGVQLAGASSANVNNSILWSDVPTEYEGKVAIRYSCITGGAPGVGNTDDDPRLVDAIGEDLHLRVGSSCIDKGDKNALVSQQDQDGRPRLIGTAPDMGAFEFPITKPNPAATTSSNEVFVVPHDGNPNTDTVTVTVKGSGYDGLLGALSYQWSVDSEVVGNNEVLTTQMEPGTRIFQLEVRDSQGGFTRSDTVVKVLPEPNAAPIASAGSDRTLTATGGTVQINLHGHGYDSDGDSMTYKWSNGATTEDTSANLAPGNYTFTFSVTDPYGTTGTASVHIHVLDGTGPVVTLNGITPMVLEVFAPWVDPGATATDAVDGGNLAVTVAGSVDNSKLGAYTLTYTAKDSSGNVGSAVRTVNVVDTVGPVITLKGQNPMSVQCGSGYKEPGATAIDALDGNVPVTISGLVPSVKGTYTVTYKASDSSGNTSAATRTVSVSDTTPPVITLNGTNPMSVECGEGYVEPGATATDSCDGSGVPVTIFGSVSSATGDYTITYTATDAAGNVATATRTVTVGDTTAPVITLNGANPMAVECGKGYAEPGATAKDSCDNSALKVTISGSVPASPGSYTVTYTAIDSSGNKATAARTVVVSDTAAPVITLNGANPMTVECGQGYVEPGATAKDGCDSTSISVKISGSVSSIKGTYSVTYTAVDSAGNKATATRTVVVADTTPPVITLTGSTSVIVECGQGYTELGATALDICDGIVAVKITGSVAAAKGSYTVTYTATDGSGNKATATRTVTVSDSTAPVITLNGVNPMTVECGTGYVEPGATATDSCDAGTIAVVTSGTVPTFKGTYTITYTATDSSGNKAIATRTVVVADTKPPVITLNGANPTTVECSKGYVELGATAMDSCQGSLPVTISGAVSSGKGAYTVTYTATDSSGNKATATRTVNVTDTTPPVITLNGSNPMTVQCGSGYGEPGASALDSCDGVVSVAITGSVSGSKGTYTVSYKATDSAGNSVTLTRTVNVVDTTAPVITLKGSNPMTVDLATGVYVEPGATAADACDGSVLVTISGSVSAVVGTYTVTYTATDGTGNTSTATRTVNVVDTGSGPKITGLIANPPSLNSQNQNMKAITLTYSVTDAADPAPTITVTATSSDADSGVFPGDLPGDIVVVSGSQVNLRQEHAPGKSRTYTITVKVTDKNGKTASASVNVISQ